MVNGMVGRHKRGESKRIPNHNNKRSYLHVKEGSGKETWERAPFVPLIIRFWLDRASSPPACLILEAGAWRTISFRACHTTYSYL